MYMMDGMFEVGGPSGPFCLNWDLWDREDLWDFVVANEEGLRWGSPSGPYRVSLPSLG